MTHIELFVEEPSAEAALENLLPRMLEPAVSYQIHAYQGKQDLLSRLPTRLRGYAHWMPDHYKIVVLVDEDRQDCHALKQELEDIAIQAGFTTKSSPDRNGNFQIINRIAIEELEAWFLGDVSALCQAYPRIPETLHRQSRYRDPDAVSGGTWEALERLLIRKNYYSSATGMPKIETARKISQFMEPARNRSRSFQVFHNAPRIFKSYFPPETQHHYNRFYITFQFTDIYLQG